MASSSSSVAPLATVTSVAGIDRLSVALLPVGRQRRAQPRHPGAGGVLIAVLVDVARRRLLDERGRREVGEALAQVGGAVLHRQRGDLGEDRRPESAEPTGRSHRHRFYSSPTVRPRINEAPISVPTAVTSGQCWRAQAVGLSRRLGCAGGGTATNSGGAAPDATRRRRQAAAGRQAQLLDAACLLVQAHGGGVDRARLGGQRHHRGVVADSGHVDQPQLQLGRPFAQAQLADQRELGALAQGVRRRDGVVERQRRARRHGDLRARAR